jgi:hypothetical protein
MYQFGKIDLFDSYNTLLSKAIELNLQVIEHYLEKESLLSPEMFAKEFRTIKFDLGRRVGKSNFIIQNCKPNDFIFVFSETEKTVLKTII